MSAKKKRTRKLPTVTLRKKALDALMLLAGDFESCVETVEGWRERMETAEALLEKGEATMFEHAGVVVELNQKLAAAQARAGEHLTAIRPMGDEHRQYRAAESAEIAYWMGEVKRLHHELIEIHRERARDG